MMPAPALDQLLLTRRVLICCGTGGVGKTTVSAALALRAAALGKKAVVVTIDPAKRLTTSLGIESLGDDPTDLTGPFQRIHERHAGSAQPLPGNGQGSIHAIVPDTRSTFESFVRRLAPDPGLAERIIRNPIFQVFAKEFSGSNEYMAMERLRSLVEGKHYDLIVLDTPPSRNTLAFLEAPALLGRFFEDKLIRWLVLPANRLVQGGMKKAMGILERLTGSGFMSHLFEFSSSLFEVRASFAANFHKITELLQGADVGFLLVAAPAPDTAPEALHFIDSVAERRFHFEGVIVNRTLSHLNSLPEEGATPPLEPALDLLKGLQEREAASLRSLSDALASRSSRGAPSVFLRLPELARDVHSLEDLAQVLASFQNHLPSAFHSPQGSSQK
jgi:anion-transporting  ArsA/GET3 family ATPase